jgi:hypothetical protein
MMKGLFFTLSCIGAAAILCVFLIMAMPRTSVVYDCRLSEISPDFPPEVRDQCRKLRYENWKQEQQNKLPSKMT